MAKLKKKGEAGAAVRYMTRTQAVRKLQVTLADFRRLCILKGIYPREPKNKKKANKGSTAPTTFYYTKDIQYLAHEPILKKFREYKIFLKKLNKRLRRGDDDAARVLMNASPNYRLDHVVKERYPTFVDAVRDLDDALSMLFLFATIPPTDAVRIDVVQHCQRLTAEFQHYVMHSRSLRKVFLSIKGIYYQAEIGGQPVTWLVPYQFAQNVPTDVDFRVMGTFLEFYRTLMAFINFKLYHDVNLMYPPKLDEVKEDNAAGLNALIVESMNRDKPVERGPQEDASTNGHKQLSAKEMARLQDKIAHIEENGDDTPIPTTTTEDEDMVDEFKPVAPYTAQDGDALSTTTVTLQQIQDASSEIATLQHLFSNCVIFLSRETPRHALEFIIRSFGGQVGWDETTGSGSPFAENDPRITHHVADRPVQSHRFLSRDYVQPQWIVDCVNARKLLRADVYEPGHILPPHLSPFVEANEGDYIPSADLDEEDAFEGVTEDIAAADVERVQNDEDKDSDSEDVEENEDEGQEASEDEEEEGEEVEDEETESGSEEDEEESDNDTSEEKNDAADQASESDEEVDEHQAELEAEAAGIPYSEYQQQQAKKQAKAKAKPAKKPMKRTQEDEEKELAKIMMSNKQKKLYEKMQYGKKMKADQVAKLQERKRLLSQKSGQASKKARH